MVMFDLPTITTEEKREYLKFRKFLLKDGFLMMQESIYSKLVLNTTVANIVTENVRKNKPQKGLVQMLVVTEKQFSKMELLIGETKSEIIDSDERLIVL
jgi:CRISPR-associated protein Cas2